jgi:DinB family protein
MPPADAELKEYDYQFAQIEDEVRALLAGLDDRQVNWRPAPDGWSISECLMHLAVAGETYLPVLDGGIAAARAAGFSGQGPFRYRWLDRAFVRFVEPPPRMRFTAQPVFRPPAEPQTTDAVGRRFGAMHDAIRARLQQADGLDLKRQRVRSPASRRVTLSLGAAFALLAAHERRHVWQAQRVRSAAAFPR